MKVRDEIEKYSTEADKPILLWLLGRYSWESRWHFVAACEHRRYGKLSYETHRVWRPTKEGVVLYENLHNAEEVKSAEV